MRKKSETWLAEQRPPQMSKQNSKFVHIVAILPFFATIQSPFLSVSAPVSSTKAHLIALEETAATSWKEEARREREERAAKIDAFFGARDMPLAGTGRAMVAAAEENGLDWRLLPAIAVRESSGGKQMCGANPFGWASCRVHFGSIAEAIDTVAYHLGGNHPKTERYYQGDTRDKLYHYNGTVIPTYADEIFTIMAMVEGEEAR